MIMEQYLKIDNDFNAWKGEQQKKGEQFSVEARNGSHFIYESLKQLDVIIAQHRKSKDKLTRLSVAAIKGERRRLEKQLATGGSYLHRLVSKHLVTKLLFRAYRRVKAKKHVEVENKIVTQSIARIDQKIQRLAHPQVQKEILEDLGRGKNEVIRRDSLQLNNREKIDFDLGIRKMESGYVMHNYSITHTDSKKPNHRVSYQFNEPGLPIPSKDIAINLVQGRPVQMYVKTPYGIRLEWVQLDLKNKDENGNNLLIRFDQGARFNLDIVIHNSGLTRIVGEAECARIKDGLRRGESVEISHPRLASGERVNLTLNIIADSLTIIDKNGDRIEITRNQQQYPRVEKYRQEQAQSQSERQNTKLRVAHKAM